MMKSMYYKIQIYISDEQKKYLITVKNGILNFENPGYKKIDGF